MEALKRVCTFAISAYDDGFHPHHPNVSGASKQQADHPQPWDKYNSTSSNGPKSSAQQSLDRRPSGGGDYPQDGADRNANDSVNSRPSASEPTERGYQEVLSGRYDDRRETGPEAVQREARGYMNIEESSGGRSEMMAGGGDGDQRGSYPREADYPQQEDYSRKAENFESSQNYPSANASRE